MPGFTDSGVMIDGLYSVEYAIQNLALPPAGKTGSTVRGNFQARGVAQAKIEGKPAKVGAQIGLFDPEVAALLAGELG